jgi:hypothetical protein
MIKVLYGHAGDFCKETYYFAKLMHVNKNEWKQLGQT